MRGKRKSKSSAEQRREEVGLEEKGKGDRLRRGEAITSISVFVVLSHASALMQVRGRGEVVKGNYLNAGLARL